MWQKQQTEKNLSTTISVQLTLHKHNITFQRVYAHASLLVEGRDGLATVRYTFFAQPEPNPYWQQQQQQKNETCEAWQENSSRSTRHG